METIKEYTDALKQYLQDRSWSWKSSYTEGGCETCGWGGEEVETIDGDALWAEIDKFCEQFKKD